jgi:hypothetical protein
MKIKPGYRTSEFWFTVVSFIFSGLYLLGLIGDNSQKEDLIRDVSHGVESVILIGGQLIILWKYINSRKEIKQTWWGTIGDQNNSNSNINTTTNTETNLIGGNNNVTTTRKSKSKSKTTRASKKQPRKSK